MLPKRCSKGNNNSYKPLGQQKCMENPSAANLHSKYAHTHTHTQTDTHTSKRAHTDCQHRLKNKATVWRLFQLYM